MSKIRPSELRTERSMAAKPTVNTAESWTVWKKSSMAFVGSDGFSIFDGNGKLAFRVDNYSRRNKYLVGELLLTDVDGRPLLALKPQILSLHDQWNGYSITASFKTLIFTMKQRSILKNRDDDVEIFLHKSRGDKAGSKSMEEADYRIQGCFQKRSCKIWGRSGKLVAWISRKMVSPLVILDDDVFRLIMAPGNHQCELIMAFIVIMDRICRKPFNFMLLCH
ncbi:Protein LURP-one-related 8 [Dendrobium catenatum]|uniref:Protein LURP-one-related 8 n=2 Tax=Dendrobium catenatum TaxID=906689 RepID=A0A2I0W3K0_9ASPA|nr:Protein LURP-one-related 8 [Dendrobium catenatum]